MVYFFDAEQEIDSIVIINNAGKIRKITDKAWEDIKAFFVGFCQLDCRGHHSIFILLVSRPGEFHPSPSSYSSKLIPSTPALPRFALTFL